MSAADTTEWQGGNLRLARDRGHRWRRFLWSLVYPRRTHAIMPTVSGLLLITVAVGIGAAAYNTANNILFITLSLLLACLVFSGVLSQLNLRRVNWRLRVTTPLRAGQEHTATLELRNRKGVLPTYGLWFEFRAGAHGQVARLPLNGRLDPGTETRLDWTFRPERRGHLRVELVALGSLFPFGFLRKSIATDLGCAVVVWPAPVEYRRLSPAGWRQAGQGGQKQVVGRGGDLLALRPYVQGDAQRSVHWKASARLRRLVVRQHAAETQAGYALWVQTTADLWPRPEQFELLCSFVGTLAEDLFRAGHLMSYAWNDLPPQPVRRARDLDLLLDRLALAERTTEAQLTAVDAARVNLLTFAPDGTRGVVARIEGRTLAAA